MQQNVKLKKHRNSGTDLERQIRRIQSRLLAPSQQELLQAGGASGTRTSTRRTGSTAGKAGSTVEDGEVIPRGLGPELVEDVGAGAEEVGGGVHHASEVDGGVGAPVGLAHRSTCDLKGQCLLIKSD